MRTLKRNKRKVWYALYSSKVELKDEYGYRTGEYGKGYTDPVALWINVSPASGNASVEPFGTNLDYTHIMVTTDMECPIDEESILWVGISPTKNGQSVPNNYRVIRVAKSVNGISYAIREVE